MKFFIDNPFGYEEGLGCAEEYDNWVCTRLYGHRSWHVATIEYEMPLVAWYDGQKVWKSGLVK